jgi:hypothetical protein
MENPTHSTECIMPVPLLPFAPLLPVEPSTADSRIHPRRTCSLPATCRPASSRDSKESRTAATIIDISQGGVRILLQRRFEAGTGLVVELPGAAPRESTVVFVKVIHVRAEDNGMWSLGCQFVQELSEDELERLLTATNHVHPSLLDSYLDDSASESACGSVSASACDGILSEVHLLAETRAGNFVDYVIKRLDVSRSWPLTPGKILSVSGKTANHGPWSLRIKVVQCVCHGDAWEIQGRVIEPATR